MDGVRFEAEYIKQCEKAVEVQEWKTEFQTGDYLSTGRSWALMRDLISLPKGDFIWLPTQSQLQGMVKRLSLEGLYQDFDSFVNIQYDIKKGICGQSSLSIISPLNLFNSMEQLWLAFVMFEKFNKTWYEGDWVTASKGHNCE